MTRLLPFLLALVGCAPTDGEVLVVGDSIFRSNWLKLGSVSHVLQDELGVTVVNRSVSGSQFTDGENRIPNQYQPGSYTWVVVDGGGNDLNKQCACDACEEVLDALVSADGSTGAIPQFFEDMGGRGLRVAAMGYYAMPADATLGFSACNDEFDTLRTRLELAASASDHAIFIDGRDAFTPDQPRYFHEDKVHPSLFGSAALGELIAKRMKKAGFTPSTE